MADYPKQLRERITKFREQKGVSESRMSRELGQSKCYLQQISSGKTLPSMGAFFRIGVCKKYDKGRCRLLAHVGKIFERPGIYFKKSNLIFQKRPGKAQSASPWRNILPGLVFLCVFIKG